MTEPKQKPGRSKQDYGTPPDFLRAVKDWLGIAEFDCDLAASPENAVAPIYITANTDALKLKYWDFGRGWNWLNPPFQNIAQWVKKAREESEAGIKTVMLIPAAVGSNWWRDWVHQKADVYFVNPRLTFVGCKDPYPKDCALLLYDGVGEEYSVWTWKPSRTVDAVDPQAGAFSGSPARENTT